MYNIIYKKTKANTSLSKYILQQISFFVSAKKIYP